MKIWTPNIRTSDGRDVLDGGRQEEDAGPADAHAFGGVVIRLRDDDPQPMPRGDEDEVRVTAVDEPRPIAGPQSAAGQHSRRRRGRAPPAAQSRDHRGGEEDEGC